VRELSSPFPQLVNHLPMPCPAGLRVLAALRS
jgi:hypothetical protein